MIHSKIQNLSRQSAAATDQQSLFGNIFLFDIDNLRSTIHYPLAIQSMKSTAPVHTSHLVAIADVEAEPIRAFFSDGRNASTWEEREVEGVR